MRHEGSEGSKGSEGSEGVVSPLRAMSILPPAAAALPLAAKTIQPRLRRDGNAPLFPYGYFHLKVKRLTTFCASLRSYKMCSLCTPEGEVLAAHYLELLMSSTAEQRVKFPLRGKGGALAPKGVHFHRPPGRLCGFSYIFIAHRRYHNPQWQSRCHS